MRFTPDQNYFGTSDELHALLVDDSYGPEMPVGTYYLNEYNHMLMGAVSDIDSALEVTLNIAQVDDPLVVDPSSDLDVSTEEDTETQGGIYATDGDGLKDGSIYSISSEGQPNNGSAVIDPETGGWRYTPDLNFFGEDTFVTITDDLGNERSTDQGDHCKR